MTMQAKSATPRIDIERAARQALSGKKPNPDLLKHGFPFTPGGWNIVIEPLEPREITDGGLIIADISQEAESFQITIGRVLKAGPTSMQGRTSSGIDLSVFTEDIKCPADLIGKFVIYQRFAGHQLKLRRTGQKIIVMDITELLGVTDDPDAFKFYV